MKIRHHVPHGEARAKAYREMGNGEQLDAIWKILDALIAGKAPPADAMAVREAVRAIKQRHPKD